MRPVSFELAASDEPDYEYNAQRLVFSLKGDSSSDTDEVVRAGIDIRCFGLQNTDHKIGTFSVNNCLKMVLPLSLRFSQRGFTATRQFSENITELDVLARIKGVSTRKHMHPVLALWEFATAFPSLAHAYLLTLLEGVLESPALGRHIFTHYRMVSVVDSFGWLVFFILCGVIQGCPLSGSLFAIAADPFLRILHTSRF